MQLLPQALHRLSPVQRLLAWTPQLLRATTVVVERLAPRRRPGYPHPAVPHFLCFCKLAKAPMPGVAAAPSSSTPAVSKPAPPTQTAPLKTTAAQQLDRHHPPLTTVSAASVPLAHPRQALTTAAASRSAL